MTGVLIKRGHSGPENMERRQCGEAQGEEPRREARNRLSPADLSRNQSGPCLDGALQASRMVRKSASVV